MSQSWENVENKNNKKNQQPYICPPLPFSFVQRNF